MDETRLVKPNISDSHSSSDVVKAQTRMSDGDFSVLSYVLVVS